MAENLAGERKETAQEMLENAGYGEGVAKTPSRVIQSRGVQQELRKLGFDPEDAKTVVAEILNTGTNREKITAAKEIFKVTGQYAPIGLQVNKRPYQDLSDDELDAEIARMKKELRKERRMPEDVQKKLAKMEEEIARIAGEFGVR